MPFFLLYTVNLKNKWCEKKKKTELGSLQMWILLKTKWVNLKDKWIKTTGVSACFLYQPNCNNSRNSHIHFALNGKSFHTQRRVFTANVSLTTQMLRQEKPRQHLPLFFILLSSSFIVKNSPTSLLQKKKNQKKKNQIEVSFYSDQISAVVLSLFFYFYISFTHRSLTSFLYFSPFGSRENEGKRKKHN